MGPGEGAGTGGSWWGSPEGPQGVRSQRPPGEDGAQGEEGSREMLSRGGCGGLGALMVTQGGVLGAVGAGGTSPIPKISPHPGGGRERGAFLCRQLSRWGGWKCIPLGGRDGSWGGLDRDGGNKRHMLDPPPCLLGLILPAGLGKEEGAGWAPYEEAASTACPPSPSAAFPGGG